jgi:hypothetical protein
MKNTLPMKNGADAIFEYKRMRVFLALAKKKSTKHLSTDGMIVLD